MTMEVFPPLWFFGRVEKDYLNSFLVFGIILQWSYLILDCFIWGRFLIAGSIFLLVLSTGEEKFSSTLLESPTSSENYINKNILTGIKHTNLFNISFAWNGSLHKEMGRAEEMAKPESFYVRFDEEWTVMEKYDRSKGMT